MKTQTYFGGVLGTLLLYACCSFGLSAKVTLPALVSDGVVLQREVPLKICGTASPGEKVNLTFMKKQYHTVADEVGNWSIGLPALDSGGPYSMTVNDMYRSDIGLHGEIPWYAEAYDDTDWERVDMFSDNWALRNGRPLNGTHWFRKEFVVPDGWAGKDVVLQLGCMVDADSVYVNGQFMGAVSYQYPPRIYQVPAKFLKEWKNQLTVRLCGYVSCPSFVKEKPYKLLCGNQEINLEGRWKHKIGTVMPSSPSSTAFHYTPVGLYNGMICPLQHYVFKGVIWYQGESNVDRWSEYSSLLTAMIADWRALFQNENLPFYVVELADFLAPNDPGRTAWAELRKRQARAAQENMYVTLIKNGDMGEWNDIHLLDKKTPVTRLVNAVIQNEKQNK